MQGDDDDDDNDDGGGGGGGRVTVEKFENEVHILREGIKELQVRHEDMMDTFKKEMGVIKSLLFEVTGRSADGMNLPIL